MNAIATNCKTYRCLDLTTVCPKKAAGNPCPYCYVEAARKVGYRAKLEHDRIQYSHEILRLKEDSIRKLNECGGLRMFSFGDYISWMDPDIESIIEDSRKKGLHLKAITKSIQFAMKFGNEIDTINVSVDTLGHGMNHLWAKRLRNKFPNVFIRAAILSHEDLDLLDWVDIITLNHGPNKFYHFTKKEKQKILEKYPNKLCCVTGKCISCKIKCRGIK